MGESWETAIAAIESAAEVRLILERADFADREAWEWARHEVAMLRHWARVLRATEHAGLGADFDRFAEEAEWWLSGLHHHG